MKPTKHNVNDLYARALSHHSKGNLALAIKKYREIVEYFPQHIGCLHNLARLAMSMNSLTEAVAYLNRVIELNREDHEAFLYRADSLRLQHKTDLALEDCHASIAVRDTALAHNTLALIYRDLERFDLAQTEWERCFELEPENRAKWAVNMGQMLMLTRDYATGFKLYEGRLHAGVIAERAQVRGKAAWTGQTTCQGLRVIMYQEQGIGDCIQMLRYAEVLHGMGARWVGVVVAPELVDLAKTVPGVDQVVQDGDDWPLWDLHLSLMSAPRALRTLFHTIPWTGTYIRPRQQITASSSSTLRVGLVWSGGQRVFHEDMWMRPPKSRDIAQETMLTWVREVRAQWPTIELVSLQTGRPVPSDSGLTQPSLSTWSQTADEIEGLDLVISVDTAVAHLAGAMGRPVWLLNRKATDWRWHLDLDTSPWYPSMRIFRQEEFMAWHPVLEQVKQALGDLVNGKA